MRRESAHEKPVLRASRKGERTRMRAIFRRKWKHYVGQDFHARSRKTELGKNLCLVDVRHASWLPKRPAHTHTSGLCPCRAYRDSRAAATIARLQKCTAFTLCLCSVLWFFTLGGSEPIPNAADVRKGIDQRIRELQRQAVPAEPTEASLRRQVRAQQPGRRRDDGRGGVAGV